MTHVLRSVVVSLALVTLTAGIAAVLATMKSRAQAPTRRQLFSDIYVGVLAVVVAATVLIVAARGPR